MLVILYLALAAYLPISRILPPGRSTWTPPDAWMPLVPWFGPVYVLGMAPIALLPVLFYRRLPATRFRRYALAVTAAAVLSYAIYLIYPTEIRRPPLPELPSARWCLGLAYAARGARGILPSGHALYTAVNAWFLCPLVPGGWRWLVAAGSVVVIASALLTRLHYVADVAAGLALAAIAVAGAGQWVDREAENKGNRREGDRSPS
jgi:hypothetical protein